MFLLQKPLKWSSHFHSSLSIAAKVIPLKWKSDPFTCQLSYLTSQATSPLSLLPPGSASRIFSYLPLSIGALGMQSHSLVCVCVQLCPTLWNPMDCSPPGASVHGISQVRIQEWVAISSSRGSSWLRDRTHVSCVSCTGSWILYRLSHLGSPRSSLLHYITFQLISQCDMCCI